MMDGGAATGTTASVGVSVASSNKPTNSGDQTYLTRLRIVKINNNYSYVLPIPFHLLSDRRMESPPPLVLPQG